LVSVVVVLSLLALGVGYMTYGRWVCGRMGLSQERNTPAHTMGDGVDFVPAGPSMLMAQHFSAIAAAGPIVGPILAGIWFGWVPALLWIVLGCIFVGGVHDFAALLASVRHRASSIGEIVRRYMSPTSRTLFLIFVWLTLTYVIIAFTDVTAQTFKIVANETDLGPGVAVSSGLYLLIGVGMGVALFRFRVKLWLATAICVPLVFAAIWAGTALPAEMTQRMQAITVKQWEVGLLAYCFVAALMPMWLLLQPRGYLGGWFLYLTMAVALLGALFGGFAVQYPAFNLDGLKGLDTGKLLLPGLFITVACGACSGFHGIVSAGTTSRQLDRECDARPVGYGAMVLEGGVAVLALATVMMLKHGDPALGKDPNVVYANGLARYLGLIGIDTTLALSFALVAFSTFVYDTLDVCTRLGRYVLEELLGLRSKTASVAATAATLVLPLIFLMLTKEKGYLVAWPVFGTTNQLLACLTLLAITMWLARTGRNPLMALIPMLFMLVVTFWSLALLILPFVQAIPNLAAVKPDVIVSGVVGILLLALAVWLVIEAVRVASTLRRATPEARECTGG
jgi:carbon starvation protein